jgi:ABC-type amino acid transport substrate-binding protein
MLKNQETPVATPHPKGGLLSRRQCLSLVPAGLVWASSAHAQQEPTPMEKIRSRGTLKVALYKDNAPYSDGDAKGMEGLDVDIAKALTRQMGLGLSLLPFDAGENMGDDFRNMVWKGHYMGYGPADVMLHVPVDQYLMNANKQILIFNPYCREQLALLQKSTEFPALSKPEELQGLRIAVEQDAGSAATMLSYGAGALRNQVMLFKSGMMAAKAVLAGQADVAYITRAQAEATVFQAKAAGNTGNWRVSNFTMPGALPNGWPLGMAVKIENRELVDALDKAMNELRSSGELVQIFKSNGLTLVAP